jgi:mono/diheme cytochrome c family protein
VLATVATLTLIVSTWTALAQAPRTIADGVYTDAQATRGQTTYGAECAPCHGATLGGGLAPPLVGSGFLRTWDKRPVIELVDKIQKTMPATSPGTLSR